MAYQPYPCGGYQPAPYYPGPVPDQLAQLRQQQIQPMMQGAQNGGIIWVSGKGEADGYLVAPNSAVALWDANNPVIYLRKADSTGKPSTVVYDLVERTDGPPAQPVPQIDWDKIVTWDKLDKYLEERLKKPARATTNKEDE